MESPAPYRNFIGSGADGRWRGYRAARAMLRNLLSALSPREGRTTGVMAPCRTLAIRAWMNVESVLWRTLPTSIFGRMRPSARPSRGEERPFVARACGDTAVPIDAPDVAHVDIFLFGADKRARFCHKCISKYSNNRLHSSHLFVKELPDELHLKFRQDAKGVRNVNALRPLMCIEAEGTDVHDRDIQCLYLV